MPLRLQNICSKALLKLNQGVELNPVKFFHFKILKSLRLTHQLFSGLSLSSLLSSKCSLSKKRKNFSVVFRFESGEKSGSATGKNACSGRYEIESLGNGNFGQ